MHYKNGREAKVGDAVIGLNNGIPFAGVTVKTVPGSNSCNLVVAPIKPNEFLWVTASDALHADDAMNPAPPGA